MPLTDYAQPELFERLAALRLRSRATVDGQFAGQHTSSRVGRAIEFSHHREYTPGDDPRRVDWKVFGRSDRLYVKQQEDESELSVNLVLDISGSMRYPVDDIDNKFRHACRIAVSIAHLARLNNDAVSLSTFDHDTALLIPPSLAVGPEGIANAVDRLPETTEQEDVTARALDPLGQRLATSLPRSSLVFWIGDCLDDPAQLQAAWRHFASRRQELIVFQPLHRDEIDFPFDAQTRFLSLESGPPISLDPVALRGAYQRTFAAHQEELRAICRSLQADFVTLPTDRPLVENLPVYFAERLSRGN